VLICSKQSENAVDSFCLLIISYACALLILTACALCSAVKVAL